jgi:hypothetical protein
VGAGLRGGVDLPERTGRHLCGGRGGMAQEFLDYPDVGVAFKEVCGERVPQDRDFVSRGFGLFRPA